jgi:hypothetical protein
MKLMLLPQELSWWLWTITALLLFTGLAGLPAAFVAAVLLSAIQTAYYYRKLRLWSHYALQVRLAYTLLMLASYPPFMRWFYWLPAAFTLALITVGYCLMSRLLSVMPWNRREPLSFDLLRRAFFTPPVAGRIQEPVTDTSCPGGVCLIEARATEVYRRASVVPN